MVSYLTNTSLSKFVVNHRAISVLVEMQTLSFMFFVILFYSDFWFTETRGGGG